jgi:hypothetical protein
MTTEPASHGIEEDTWGCLGAISIDRLNILVFWKSCWLSAHEYHALHEEGHQGWLVHARDDDQLLIAWEPTMERKSDQSSPRDLLKEFAIEVRKNRPGLLGYVAAKDLRDSPNAGSRRLAFLAYWKVAPMEKDRFYDLQQAFSSCRGYIVHEEQDRVWVQWEPTWVFYENLDQRKKDVLLRLSDNPKELLHRFHKSIVHYSTRLAVQKRIT